MFCTFGGRDRSGGRRKNRGARGSRVLQAREPVARCVGLQGCLRGPGVPPPPAEPRLFSRQPLPLPASGAGPPREPCWLSLGAKRARSEPPALAARGPQVANRSVRRTLQLKFPQATPVLRSLSFSPSCLRSGPQASPKRPRRALSSGSLARAGSRYVVPALPNSTTSNPALREQGWGERRLPNAGRKRQRRASEAGGLPRTPIAFSPRVCQSHLLHLSPLFISACAQGLC